MTTLIGIEQLRRGRLRRHPARHLRAFAVDPAARRAQAPVRHRRRAQAGAAGGGRQRHRGRAAAPDPRPPRTGGQGGDRRPADAGVDQRAGQVGPEPVQRGGIRDAAPAERRLQRQVRLPLHPRGEGPGRQWPDAPGDHRDLHAPAEEPARRRDGRMPAPDPPHRRTAHQRPAAGAAGVRPGHHAVVRSRSARGAMRRTA